MSLTLLYAGTGQAGDGSSGPATLVSITISPNPGTVYQTTLEATQVSPSSNTNGGITVQNAVLYLT